MAVTYMAVTLMAVTRLIELLIEVVQVARLLRVFRKVLLERAHEDERDDAGEEDDHHEGVEDGKPEGRGAGVKEDKSAEV